MIKTLTALILISSVYSCFQLGEKTIFPWNEHGKLKVEKASAILQHEDGTPFLWLGCTAWGMTEWLSREEVDVYLDDRKSKGMNVVQLCLFFGKREENPVRFTANAENHYGHKAFQLTDGIPNPLLPDIKEGGTSDNPNDYWDHVDYCLNAIKKRGMYAAVLPFWGRRYVNATHEGQSLKLFTTENIFQYGVFLSEKYGNEPHIIWVNGGDVKANSGGDFLPHYRLLAEGLVKGITGKSVKWNQFDEAWDSVLITYHPDGTPLTNSSEWFQSDIWLDFNMIETHIHRDKIVKAVQQDLMKTPLKPTILSEGHYEGNTNGKTAEAIHIRRQAYQSFFAGAAGHTYGGAIDENGNGPLFCPANNWQVLLSWEGASQMIYLKHFLEENEWWKWKPEDKIILNGKGEGELEKLAVRNKGKLLVYFPENSGCVIDVNKIRKMSWYNTENGETIGVKKDEKMFFCPPEGFEDGVLVISY